MRGEGADVARIRYSLELETPGTGKVSAQVRDLGDAQDLDAALARVPKGSGSHVLRLKAVVPGHRHPLTALGGEQNAAHGSRAVAWARAPEATPVYDWDGLAIGTTFSGPAIVESVDTTIPIPPGHQVTVGGQGELRVTGGA
jgi:N-methylhydantoinase A/oxoprolinase/acetone carboxylase beta subunit